MEFDRTFINWKGYIKRTIDWLYMRGYVSGVARPFSLLWETSRGGRCIPMDIVIALTLMISFGMKTCVHRF